MKLESTVINLLYNSKEFWDKYISLIEEDFFVSQTHKELYKLINKYWTTIYSTSDEDRFNSIKELINIHISNDTLQRNCLTFLNKIASERPSVDAEAIFKEAIKSWRVRKILYNATNSLSTNSLSIDELYEEVEKLLILEGEEEVEEIFPQDSVEEILSEETTETRFPTGLTQLDEQLEGGIWSGEIGMILGPSFRGKTWALIYLGAKALLLGIPVIHFTLEISRRRVAIRYFQSLLERTRKAIMEDIQESSAAVRSLELPPWSIKDYAATSTNTSQIDRDIRSFIQRTGTTPLVIIDYADLVSPVSKQGVGNEYVSLGKVVEELRRIANKYNTAIWTASQTNRASYSSPLIGMSEVSDSIRKIQTADVIITLNQNIEEYKNLLMRWWIDKARERELKEKEIQLKALAPFQRFEDLF